MQVLLIEDSHADVTFFRLALAPLSPLVQLIVVTDEQQALDFLTRR